MSAGRAGFGLVLLVILSAPAVAGLPLLPRGSAPGDPTPEAPNAIDASYEVRLLEDWQSFRLDFGIEIYEHQLAGPIGASAQDIREGSLPVRALFEDLVRESIESKVQRTFVDDSAWLGALRFSYGESDFDGDPYRPSIRVEGTANAQLNERLLGMPGLREVGLGDLVHTFLLSGGTFTLDRLVDVPAGYNLRLRVDGPEGLWLTTPEAPNATAAEFSEENFAGGEQAFLRLHLQLGLLPELVPRAVREEVRVRLEFVVDDETSLWQQTLPLTQGTYSADLRATTEISAIPAPYLARHFLPPGAEIESVSVDLVRIAVAEGAVNESVVRYVLGALVTEGFHQTFGDEAEPTIDWATFTDSMTRPLGGADGQGVAPLVMTLRGRVPLESDYAFVASGVARTVGTVVPISSSFDMVNGHGFPLEIRVLYPEGYTIEASDSEGALEPVSEGDREGFQVLMEPGQSTTVTVAGRYPPTSGGLLIGALELVLASALLLWCCRGVARRRAGRAARAVLETRRGASNNEGPRGPGKAL